jgi:hypothetical protein
MNRYQSLSDFIEDFRSNYFIIWDNSFLNKSHRYLEDFFQSDQPLKLNSVELEFHLRFLRSGSLIKVHFEHFMMLKVCFMD